MSDRDHDARAPLGWGEAFAALPQACPDAGGWQRVQARLPSPEPARIRARWPRWLATVASLALAAAIPLRMLPQAEPRTTAPVPQARASHASATPAARSTTAALASTIASQPAPVSVVVRRDPPPRLPPSQRPVRTAAAPGDATRVAAADADVAADLEPLYARSAQLESLLALARDDRVASGTPAALSDALGARVAGIDASLIQPGLSGAQRTNLWSRRVDALQQLVGIEATNRLYAARGQRYDAALVSID